MIYSIIYDSNPTSNDISILNQGLSQYACQQKGLEPGEPFGFFFKDEKGTIKGGCNGWAYYGCLHIDNLWMDEEFRGKGYGTKLMQAAEKLGKEKGCLFATVNTMDWEALGFYQKLGYQVEFERHGYLKNSIFYFLRKELNKV